MELLCSQRWEVSRASSEANLLNALRLNAMEYGLIRQLDLSFDNSFLFAFYHHIYWRQSELVQKLANKVPQSDHHLNSYYNELSQFYYGLSGEYHNLAHTMDPHSVTHSDLQTPELLNADLQIILETGLIPKVLQQAPQEVNNMLQSPASLETYMQEINLVDGAMRQIPALTNNPNKTPSFMRQLEFLKYFYNQVHILLNEYHNPPPPRQHPAIAPRVDYGAGYNGQQAVNNAPAMHS